MKRIVWISLFFVIIFLSGCAQKSGDVEKNVEDGIEVIVNHAEPYQIPEIQQPVRLEEELTIDLEDEDVVQAGLFLIDTFCADDEGNIYILTLRSEQDHIYKFSKEGKFITSFGQNGKGPGEIARPTAIIFTPEKTLLVPDPDNTKLLYFDQEGNLLREFILKQNMTFAYPLPNGNYVAFGRMRPDTEQRNLKYPLELCDENMKPLKTLDTFLLENFLFTRRIQGTQPGFGLAVGGGRIFVGNEAREYEIWVFDQDGELVRKIRNVYDPLPVTQEIKEAALARYNEQMRQMVFFPDTLPPFRTMTADEEGALYILTFKQGENKSENTIDVFNSEGVFIGQLNAAVFVTMDTPLNMIVHKGRFYYIRETETGFKELVVERIIYGN